jgi:hypothetical protein
MGDFIKLIVGNGRMGMVFYANCKKIITAHAITKSG